MKKEFIIFENGEYQCEFVLPGLTNTGLTDARNRLVAAMKNAVGEIPVFHAEGQVTDQVTFEFLLGDTNRQQSGVSEVCGSQTDDYYVVAVVENKLVINASNEYQLNLAVNYFIDTYLSGEKRDRLAVPLDLHEEFVLKDYSRERWMIYNIPSYPESTHGNPSTANFLVPVYNAGSTVSNFTTVSDSDKNSREHIITKTNAEEFNAYLQKLERFGFTKKYENKVGENHYLGYTKDGIGLWTSFIAPTGMARVIYDPVGSFPQDIGYSYTPKAGEQSEFYLYGIPMNCMTESTKNYMDCGQCLIVKCADNSVIIIDGGDGSKQMNAAALKGLDSFLHQITETPAGEKVRISAWYMTHYHGDHVIGFTSFLNTYGEGYRLERILANVPSQGATADGSIHLKLIKTLSDTVKTMYPDCAEIKLHAGQSIQIADVTLDVLFTHESLVSTINGAFNSGDSNDTSTVIRLHNGNLSCMVLGDANSRSCNIMIGEFGSGVLHSDILQSSHHGIYSLPQFNSKVAPTYVFLPQSRAAMQQNKSCGGGHKTYREIWADLVRLVGNDDSRIFCAGDETVGLAYDEENGEIKVIYHSTVIPGK